MELNRSLSSKGSVLLGALFLYASALLVMVAVYAQPYVKISELTKDAVVVAKGMFYYGMISNFGILLWCATASACLFTFVLLKTWKLKTHRTFLLCGGLLTTVLLLDDFFLLHEVAIPKLLGISERYVTGMYPFLIVLFLLWFVQNIWQTYSLVLLSSLCFLGLSVFTDMLAQQSTNELECLFEDGFKFMGIVGWFYYFTSTCIAVLKHGVRKKYAPTDKPTDKVEEMMGVRV